MRGAALFVAWYHLLQHGTLRITMLNRHSADEIVSMLRRGTPALQVISWALREFPDLAPLGARVAADPLERARDDFGAWLAATIAGKPIPPYVRGLWLTISVSLHPTERPPQEVLTDPIALGAWARSTPMICLPTVTLEPLPETNELGWLEILDHWKDSHPWEPAFLAMRTNAPAALEELTLVATAALLRELIAADPKLLRAMRDLRLEVRPRCSDATITVGIVGPAGFDPTVAVQNLFRV